MQYLHTSQWSLYISFSYFWVSNFLLNESVLRHNSHSISSWLNCIMQVLLSHAFSLLIMMIILATINQNLHLFWKPQTTSLELHCRSRYPNRTQKYHAEVVKKKKAMSAMTYSLKAIWEQFFWAVRSRRAWFKTDCLSNKEERVLTYWRALQNTFSLHHEKRLLFLPNLNIYLFFFLSKFCSAWDVWMISTHLVKKKLGEDVDQS